MKTKYVIAAVAGVILGTTFLFFVWNSSSKISQEHSNSLVAILASIFTSENTVGPWPTLISVGDIMLGRHVETLINQYGQDYPFKYTDETFGGADSVIANLEGPVVTDHIQTPSQSFHFQFGAAIPDVLKTHHVSIVNLANNHSYDMGQSGYYETRDLLNKAGILYMGHPYAISTSTSFIRTIIKNKKFIFVGFNITDPNFDTKKAISFIKDLNKQSDEFFIAEVHGGTEYALHSNSLQESFYRNLIDAGVDVVFGHHPHVVEEVELYHSKPIFYSLGNFIFDQYFSKDVQEELGVKFTFTSNTVTYELLPFISTRSQPKLMTESQKSIFLDSLALRSSKNIQESVRDGTITVQY